MTFTMGTRFYVLLFIFVILPQGHQAIHLSEPVNDGNVIYACDGADVTLPWRYQLESGETIASIEWFYKGISEVGIASFFHGLLLTYPVFANRISQVGNAGLVLKNVIPGDSGNYTVMITVSDSAGQLFNVHHMIVVQISDQLMTTDGRLHLTQSPEPVFDTTSGQWVIRLNCGIFTFQGQPPYSLEWTTPDNQVVASSRYEEGHFILLLASPVLGGNYTCRVPHQYLVASCQDGASAEATLSVDGIDARLSLLEKRNEQLAQETQRLAQENHHSAQENADLQQRQNVTDGRLTQEMQRLTQETQSLDERVTNLTSDSQQLAQTMSTGDQQLQHDLQEVNKLVQKLKGDSDTQVAFHARNLKSIHPPVGSPLIVKDVLTNQGGAYNAFTGKFTAPYPGTYYFTAHTGISASDVGTSLSLSVDNTVVDEAYVEHTDTSSYFTADRDFRMMAVHGVLHLNPGQTVWLKADGPEYHGTHTSFSGFLISLDP